MVDSDWGLRDYYAGDEDPNVTYTVILVAGQSLPLAVVRLTGGVEEAFTHDLRWEPSTLLSRVPGEPAWTAKPANVGYANGFLVEMVQVIRARTHLSEFADYKYFAYFRRTVDVLDLRNAHALIRRPEYYGDQEYMGHNTWEDTDRPHDVDRGEDTQGDYVAISAQEAAEFRQRLDAWWANEALRHYVIKVNGNPAAVAARSRSASASVREMVFDAESGFGPGEIVSRAEQDPIAAVEEVPYDYAVRVMAALVCFDRDQRRAGLTGGYATFQRQVDVLDLDSAIGISREPGPGTEGVSLPLSDFEAYRLFLRLSLRLARREARPVHGYYHFAVLDSLRDAADAGKAVSLIRCPADAAPRWELFLRPGEWLPTSGPLRLVTKPIGEADLHAIAARLSGETRYLQIVNGEPGFMRVIRWSPHGEATREHPDAPWQPCDVLGRWRQEPAWTITEPTWLRASETGSG